MLDYLLQIIPTIADGLKVTVSLFCIVWILSIPGGILMAMLRLSKLPLVDKLVDAFVYLMRGTPLMLQLLVVYFGPFFIFGMQITPSYRLKAVLIGFALNYAAYFAEIYRSGIAAIPVGQYEAARMLGYSKTQTFAYIVMPQVIKRIIPPVANETITLVKDTSLAFTLAVAEVFTVTKQLVASQSSVVPFIVAGGFFLIFYFFCSFSTLYNGALIFHSRQSFAKTFAEYHHFCELVSHE